MAQRLEAGKSRTKLLAGVHVLHSDSHELVHQADSLGTLRGNAGVYSGFKQWMGIGADAGGRGCGQQQVGCTAAVLCGVAGGGELCRGKELRVSDAVAALKLALEWEAEHPRMLSTASMDYPLIVAKYRIVDEYDDALMVLVDRFKPLDFSFPATRYRWNGCQALIRAELGQMDDARHFAALALVAASETQSPFRYHRTVGLVSQTSDEFGLRVKRIARPSAIRKLLRVMTGGKVR